jgi:hypothetical protein
MPLSHCRMSVFDLLGMTGLSIDSAFHQGIAGHEVRRNYQNKAIIHLTFKNIKQKYKQRKRILHHVLTLAFSDAHKDKASWDCNTSWPLVSYTAH